MNAFERAKEMATFVAQYKPRQQILWAGAGVSIPPPASLPSGEALTEFSLDHTCGPQVSRRIFRIWGRANEVARLGSNPYPLGQFPRLEAILGEIEAVQSHLTRQRFDYLRGFYSFRDARPNEYHFRIAALLQRGVTVVTTNFDDCIRRASDLLRPGEQPMLEQAGGGTYRCSIPNVPRAGNLWHIHGVASDWQSLGATLRQVKEGLVDEFRKQLDLLLKGSVAVTFLGYSASDAFDVNPYFATKPTKELATAAGLFLQHYSAAIPPSAHRLCRRFGTHRVQKADTTTFLRALTPRLKWPAHTVRNNWQAAFLAEAKEPTSAASSLLLCRLANALGINVDLLDRRALNQALLLKREYQKWDFHNTVAEAYRLQGKKRKERCHILLRGQKSGAMLGYHFAYGHLGQARALIPSIDNLMQSAGRLGSEIDWQVYTQCSVHTRIFCDQFLFGGSSRPAGSKRLVGNQLMQLWRILAVVPLRNVKAISQVATAHRGHAVLQALLQGADARRNLDVALTLYGEIARIDGFISTFCDMAISDHFRRTFFGCPVALQNSREYLDRARKLARLTGNERAKRRVDRLARVI